MSIRWSWKKARPAPPLWSRRRHVRIPVCVGVSVQTGRFSGGGTVREIAEGGALLDSPRPLQKNERVNLVVPRGVHPLGRRSLGCRVAWSRGNRAGLAVLSEDEFRGSWGSWYVKRRGEGLGVRKAYRFPCRLPVRQDAMEGMILDLGWGGARLFADSPLALDALVRLEARSGRDLPLLRPLRIAARVLSVKITRHGWWDHCLQFVAGPEAQEVLGSYLDALASEAGAG